MKVISADKQLTGDLLLYPMQGFYVLKVPLPHDVGNFSHAFISRKHIGLMNVDAIFLLSVNTKVAAILFRQMRIKCDQPNVLGICTHPSVAETALEDISLAQYARMDQLKQFVPDATAAIIQHYCMEKKHDKCA